MFKKPLVTVFLVVALAIFTGSFVLVGEHIGSSQQPMTPAGQSEPVNLIGTWTQTSGIDGVTMKATVMSNSEISVSMQSDVISGAYWAGTFKTKFGDGQILSTADGDPQLSQDTSKTFTYNNGDLSFQLSMLGQTKTVHLQRSSE